MQIDIYLDEQTIVNNSFLVAFCTRTCHVILMKTIVYDKQTVTNLFLVAFFINCYAPTNEGEVETKADFYNKLQKTLDSRTRRDILIVTGDFNAKIGKDNTGREREP